MTSSALPDGDIDFSAPPTPAASVKKPVHKRMLMSGLAVVVIALAGYMAHQWWREGRFVEHTDDAYIGGDVTTISPRVSGYIVNVAVTDNQIVHAGDLLVKLDDRDYRAALAKAEAAVAAQQALIANLDATTALQRAVITQADAGRTAAAAETERAEDDQQRYQRLSGNAAVSIQNVQRAEADYKQARAGQQKTQAGFTAAQRELDVIATRRRQAEAALAQAVADRDMAALNLGYTELRAPINGVVGNRRARNGGYTATGGPLLSIVPSHGLWVDANFKESQLARFRAGLPATIEADVLPGHVFHGHIVSLSPATGGQFSVLPAENATGNFTKIVQRVPVRIALDEQDKDVSVLRAGLSVEANIDSRTDAEQP
jgi:membrane fusion protein (multidrug efflux system)